MTSRSRKTKKTPPGETSAEEETTQEPREGEFPEDYERAPGEEAGAEDSDVAGAEEEGGESAAEEPDPEAEIASLKDQLLRTVAEMENLRRRFARELEEKLKHANSNLARDLLTVADNLNRALESVTAETRSENEHLEHFAAGIEAIERELLAAFERNNIRKIEPMGEKFDPELHHAMFEVENTGQPHGTVVKVLQPGYVLHERLLRPAMVGVARGEPDAGNVDTTA